jgi:hypothetical protein
MMDNKPQTEQEWTIHSLNIHGTIFERWCKAAIDDTVGWRTVSTNYPVEFPTAESGRTQTTSSALDILARNTQSRLAPIVTLLVECKKNNPDFVDWIFFQKSASNSSSRYHINLIHNERIEDFTDGWRVSWTNERTSAEMPIADEGREVRGTYSGKRVGDLTRTSNAAISSAAYQIALATQAIIAEELSRSHAEASRGERMERRQRIPDYAKQLFIPTIVTTAKLFLCEFDPHDVDSATGEIAFTRAKLTPQPYLIYEYPLPTSLQHDRGTKVAKLSRQELDTASRMDIVVVHSEDFTDVLMNDFVALNLPL